jgi:hypothetical protein
MYFAYAIPRVLSKVSQAFGSIFLGMHESRRRRAGEIIREWKCDENQDVRSMK